MRRRKTLVILVVAMLFLTTIAVSSVSCDEESTGEEPSDNYGEFSWEDGPGDGDAGTCGGDPGGPGGPQ